jgi:hypothetical protein
MNMQLQPYLYERHAALLLGSDRRQRHALPDPAGPDLQYLRLRRHGRRRRDPVDQHSPTSFGIQYYTRHIEFLGAQGNEFAGPGLTTIDAAALKPYAGSDYGWTTTRSASTCRRVLGFNDRLFLTGAVRVDNNSAFGSDLDFVTYPKASLAWVLSEEPSLGRPPARRS